MYYNHVTYGYSDVTSLTLACRHCEGVGHVPPACHAADVVEGGAGEEVVSEHVPRQPRRPAGVRRVGGEVDTPVTVGGRTTLGDDPQLTVHTDRGSRRLRVDVWGICRRKQRRRNWGDWVGGGGGLLRLMM